MAHRLAVGIRCLVLALIVAVGPARSIDTDDTRLLAEPAVSADHVVFTYAGDLWIVGIDGGDARRLTTHAGIESSPRLSPDGSLVAFSAQYDGNTDVYVVPVGGGEPRRLTWHPSDDVVRDFTPDGRAVTFVSPRVTYTRRHRQLFTVPIEGGAPTQLEIPYAFKASWSPSGDKIAYTPIYEAFGQWKNYRGGTVSRIWIYDVATHAVEPIPQPAGRSNDTDPMWIGDTVHFISDRDGEFNLYAYDAGTVRRLTDHDEFPIASASAGGGRIVYEQAGYLHLYTPSDGRSQRLRIGAAADLVETRPRWASGADHVRSWSVSPSGARAVFGYRGEIVTVPAKDGEPRNLSRSPGAHDRTPAWSPDGTTVAFFSDASGEYALHLVPQDGRGEPRVLPLGGSGFYDDLTWSPDGEWLSFIDNSWTLYALRLSDGSLRTLSTETVYGPVRTLSHSWSPDSRWIAYTRNTETYFQRIWLYSIDEDRSRPLTDGLSDAGQPVFDAGGEYLYFSASTDAGPVRQWFAMSNADMEMSSSLYLAVLGRGVDSPLKARSDEEEPDDEGEAKSEGSNDDGATEDEVEVTIDFEGLDQRIVALPLPPADYTGLTPGAAGQLLYLRRDVGVGLFDAGGAASLRRFGLDDREEKTLADGVNAFAVASDLGRVLVGTGSGWSLTDLGDSLDLDSGRLDLDAVQVRVDPASEWPQIFDEAWRLNRDWFYDPGMHGADWPAMRERYAPMLPHLATRADLNRVIRWMCSELAVGHHRVAGGELREEPESIPVGLLGSDYAIDAGRYRFEKVYGGLNWNPDLRAPLTEPGVDVRAGEYLLAVDGVDLRPPDNLFQRFEHTADRAIEITVGPNPDGSGARTVQVVPVASERTLRNRDWVEGNIAKVDAATGGRVAYVYVPNTTQLGHVYFKRYFFPQAHKDAIIIDERHNGGGQVADYYIDLLRRPEIAWWAMRYGQDLKTPMSSIQGPKVMVIDETAGSGGDLLPWMFRKLELGPLVGKRTWGGLVGILGFPELMDGGFVTAPNLAIWTEDGFVVENVGVPPDVEVEQWPADLIAGRDPQLERAIEIALQQLEAQPPRRPERPPFPVRAR